ncbi:PilW family protein [Teredinibacter waterburyi]|uniref:PilW family protein n=1 Tax=Teredinibacter waterburyi TaxID=1500538 RepID=UPI00165ED691|nr:PilW family protein [Teredinibacter waterburyi]
MKNTINLNLSKQFGVGLAEVMISIVVGLFILAGVFQLYATSSQNASTLNGVQVIQENARFLFSRLEDDVKQAGYAGCLSLVRGNETLTDENRRITNLIKTNAGAGQLYDFTRVVSGSNNDGAGAIASDSLVVRYASARDRYPVISTSPGAAQLAIDATAAATVKQDDVVMAGDCSRLVIFKASADGSSGTITYAAGDTDPNVSIDTQQVFFRSSTPGALDQLGKGTSPSYVYIGDTGAVEYKIGKSASATGSQDCSATTPQFCALKRNGEELVDGVESFQVEFGWQDPTDNNKLYFSDAAFVASNNAWHSVDRVRVTAILNSLETAQKNDGIGLLNKTFSRVFVLPNHVAI